MADTYFGTVIRDPYRWMEAPVGKNPEFMEYLKQQNAHTRVVLDQLPERPALLARLTELADITSQVSSLSPAEDRWFYLRMDRGEQISKLYVRDLASRRDRMLLDPETPPSPNEEHWAIDYISPAPHGRLVGYGGSLGRLREDLALPHGSGEDPAPTGLDLPGAVRAHRREAGW